MNCGTTRAHAARSSARLGGPVMTETKKPTTASPAPAAPPPPAEPVPPAAPARRWPFGISRETRLGLVVAGFFLAIVAGVIGVKSFFKSKPEEPREVVQAPSNEHLKSPPPAAKNPPRTEPPVKPAPTVIPARADVP